MHHQIAIFIVFLVFSHVHNSLSETLDTPVLSQGESVIHINYLLFSPIFVWGKKKTLCTGQTTLTGG